MARTGIHLSTMQTILKFLSEGSATTKDLLYMCCSAAEFKSTFVRQAYRYMCVFTCAHLCSLEQNEKRYFKEIDGQGKPEDTTLRYHVNIVK